MHFNTPIKKLDNIYIKLEYKNQAGSIKDRPAFYMLQDAIKKGFSEVVEATSGNTGIALSFYGKQLGVKVNIFMPKSFSVERQKLLKLYGANLILVDGNMSDALNEAKNYKNAYFTNQFDNKINEFSHMVSTAPEILSQIDKIDYFVAGVGSGGTLIGIAKKLKPKGIKIVAVESENSPVIYNTLYNKNIPVNPHKIQGIGAGFIPNNIDLSYIDEVVLVNDEEVLEFTKKLPSLGITGGISTSANIIASQTLDKTKNIITVAPDSIERYLSVF
jgi:cysteine synthase A